MLVAAALAAAQDAAPPENPDATNPEGVERTDRLDIEDAVPITFIKRETRDCVVAVLTDDADAKALAKFAVAASRIARTTWSKAKRDGPLDGAKIAIYSLPYGPEQETFIGWVGSTLRGDQQVQNSIRAQHAWYWQDMPPWVFVERNKALPVHTKEQGSHVAHGLGHAFFTAAARCGLAASPAWMAEGYACWLDRQIMPKVRLGCVHASVLGGYAKRPDWDKQIGNLVRITKDPPLGTIVKAAQASDLREAMLPKAASVCGWLSRTNPDGFWKLPHAISALGAEKAFPAVFNKTVGEIDADWRKWAADQKAPVTGGEPPKDDGKDD